MFSESRIKAEIISNPSRGEMYSKLSFEYYLQNNERNSISNCNKGIVSGNYNVNSIFSAAKLFLAYKRFDDSRKKILKCVIMDPGSVKYCNVMIECFDWGNDRELFRKAASWSVCLKPDDRLALLYLGTAMASAREQRRADSVFKKAYLIDPSATDSLRNRAQFFCEINDLESADQPTAWLAKLDPNSAEAWRLRSMAESRLHNLAAFLYCSDRELKLSSSAARVFSARIFTVEHLSAPGFSGEQEIRKEWSQRFGVCSESRAMRPQVRQPGRGKIRVGYVSGDFIDHSLGLLALTVIELHDRTKFECFLYSNRPGSGSITSRFKKNSSHWREIYNLSDEEACDLIRRDQIDILVDLSGHSARNRLLLFARKPAPIQVTAWGYAHGTGMPQMDFLFADEVAVPVAERHYFSEKIVDLPCLIPTPNFDGAPDISALPATGNGYVTFGCLGRWYKLTDRTLDLWSKVIQRVPSSKLFIKSPEMSYAGMRNRLIERLLSLGISSDRILVAGGTSRVDHLNAYSRVDICLDTLPHTGGVTTWEASYMGVPVVTRTGNGIAQRVSHSINHSIGLDDLVSESDSSFVETAAALAADLQRLAGLRRVLRKRVADSGGGNSEGYTRAVEEAYSAMMRGAGLR